MKGTTSWKKRQSGAFPILMDAPLSAASACRLSSSPKRERQTVFHGSQLWGAAGFRLGFGCRCYTLELLCKGNLQMVGFKPPKSCPLITSGRTTEALRMSGVLSYASHKQQNDRDGQKGNTFSWFV